MPKTARRGRRSASTSTIYFGKASPGGVVVIQTANPTPRFSLIGRAGYEAEADTKQTELIVSGPLTNTLGARLAGRYSHSLGDLSGKLASDCVG